MHKAQKISVLIVAYNEMNNIAEAIDSVKFADEIVVIDNGSEDNTAEIAQKSGAKVITLDENIGYSKPKMLALTKCSHDWVLWLDCDERVSPKLADEIIAAAGNEKNLDNISAFKIPRRSFFIRKFIKHSGWGNETVVRLFKKDYAKFSDNLVHESIIIDGNIAAMQNPILHYTAPDFKTFYDKQIKYAYLSAEQMFSNDKKVNFMQILIHPLAAFLKTFFLKLGFLDGIEGFSIARINSIYVFTKYSRAYYLQRNPQEMEDKI